MRSLLFLFPAVVSLAQPPAYDVIASKRIMVPMRDGVRLATDIYRPGRGGAPNAVCALWGLERPDVCAAWLRIGDSKRARAVRL